MLGLGEHVDGMDGVEMVAVVFAEEAEIAGQGGGVATHVEDLTGAGLTEDVETGWTATDARWIEEDGGEGGIEALEQAGEEVIGTAGDELAIADSAALGIAPGGLDGGGIEFDAEERFDFGGEFDAEEADAAIGVDEMA